MMWPDSSIVTCLDCEGLGMVPAHPWGDDATRGCPTCCATGVRLWYSMFVPVGTFGHSVRMALIA